MPVVGVTCSVMPWDIVSNPTLTYGLNDGLPPLVIDLPLVEGDEITIKYLSGGVAVSDSRAYFNAQGDLSNRTGDNLSGGGNFYPTHYTISKDLGLGGLCGCFTDAGGIVKGDPISIGIGGTFTAPFGTTRVQLGINDDQFRDNKGAFTVSVDLGVPDVSQFALADDTYDGGYLVYTSGKLTGLYRGIRKQLVVNNRAVFYLYEPLPFLPDSTDQFIAYVPRPRDFLSALQQATVTTPPHFSATSMQVSGNVLSLVIPAAFTALVNVADNLWSGPVLNWWGGVTEPKAYIHNLYSLVTDVTTVGDATTVTISVIPPNTVFNADGTAYNVAGVHGFDVTSIAAAWYVNPSVAFRSIAVANKKPFAGFPFVPSPLSSQGLI